MKVYICKILNSYDDGTLFEQKSANKKFYTVSYFLQDVSYKKPIFCYTYLAKKIMCQKDYWIPSNSLSDGHQI